MSEGNVIHFGGVTSLDIPCEKILQGALARKLDTVLVLGWTEAGEMYASCSSGDIPEVLFLLEKFKMELLRDE